MATYIENINALRQASAQLRSIQSTKTLLSIITGLKGLYATTEEEVKMAEELEAELQERLEAIHNIWTQICKLRNKRYLTKAEWQKLEALGKEYMSYKDAK